MNEKTEKILTEVVSDLGFAMEVGSEYGYRRDGDQILIEEYGDDGVEVTVVGSLRFDPTR